MPLPADRLGVERMMCACTTAAACQEVARPRCAAAAAIQGELVWTGSTLRSPVSRCCPDRRGHSQYFPLPLLGPWQLTPGGTPGLCRCALLQETTCPPARPFPPCTPLSSLLPLSLPVLIALPRIAPTGTPAKLHPLPPTTLTVHHAAPPPSSRCRPCDGLPSPSCPWSWQVRPLGLGVVGKPLSFTHVQSLPLLQRRPQCTCSSPCASRRRTAASLPLPWLRGHQSPTSWPIPPKAVRSPRRARGGKRGQSRVTFSCPTGRDGGQAWRHSRNGSRPSCPSIFGALRASPRGIGWKWSSKCPSARASWSTSIMCVWREEETVSHCPTYDPLRN